MSTLFCDDFTFNGKKMSEFGFSSATFSNISIEAKDIGLKKTINSVRTGINPVSTLYNVTYEGVLGFECTMIYQCGKNIDNDTFRTVVKWLTVDSYKTLTIQNDKCDDVYFLCVISDIRVYENNNIPIGIYFEVICNAPYAWEDLEIKCSSSPYTFNNTSDDVLNTLKPTFTFTKAEGGDVTITNQTTGISTIITDVQTNETCNIDVEHGIITSNINNRNFYKIFNRKWVEFVPGNNTIEFSGIDSLTIKARIPRKVGY